MSAQAISILDFVCDMDRLGVPPFRDKDDRDFNLGPLAIDMRQAALDEDAASVANGIRVTRHERLCRILTWLRGREPQHPKIALWLSNQFVSDYWRPQC